MDSIITAVRTEASRVLGDVGSALKSFSVADTKFASQEQTVVEFNLAIDADNQKSLEKYILALGRIRMLDSLRVSCSVISVSP